MTPRGSAAPPGTLAPTVARTIRVYGVVQGVGFRPFVWHLAHRLGLAGWVRNTDGVVEILAEGTEDAIRAFCDAIQGEAPTLAHVERLECEPAEVLGLETFEVDESLAAEGGERLVSPDVATCSACLGELRDPHDRRYHYPFVNCTDCGPRFTIIEELPYDRKRTSMRSFPLCEGCAREYADPEDRRFHAEPVACPACGPHLALVDSDGKPIEGDPIQTAAQRLVDGQVVAVKGLGGFHLACDATEDDVVAELRRRKARPHKPFAVMVRDLEEAQRRFRLSPVEAELLSSWRAPIVLVHEREYRGHAGPRRHLAAGVAPGHRRQGVMLPATPLHHLLLHEVHRPLVMTSGNRSDEPICTDDDEARARLDGIADAFLVHDRGIVARYDDSVARAWKGGPLVLRRARSYAPSPIALPLGPAPASPPPGRGLGSATGPPPPPVILGTGAELYGTFTLARGDRAYVSQHVGDLDSDEAMAAYREALERYERLFDLEPDAVAHDLHPDFLTTRFAESLGLPTVAVQHHHAHVAAVMAEHRLEGKVIGVAFDGFGLGDDGTAWGGEVLVADASSAVRAAHLRQVRQPGGDAAVRNPVRMAVAHAADAGVFDRALPLLAGSIDEEELGVVLGQIESGLASPLSSSAGRLFDAVSALTGVCQEATYEGQPAMLLEQAASSSATFEYPFDVEYGDGRPILDTRPIVKAVVRDLQKGRGVPEVAGRFHRTMAAAITELCRLVRGSTGLERVVLAGGVFQNDLLLGDLVARLEACDFEVFVPREVPVGDGGISLGQALVARARLGE